MAVGEQKRLRSCGHSKSGFQAHPPLGILGTEGDGVAWGALHQVSVSPWGTFGDGLWPQ